MLRKETLMNPRIKKVKELFLKLKTGHEWLMKDETPERREIIVSRSEGIFKELETLSVPRMYSLAMLELGKQLFPEPDTDPKNMQDKYYEPMPCQDCGFNKFSRRVDGSLKCNFCYPFIKKVEADNTYFPAAMVGGTV